MSAPNEVEETPTSTLQMKSKNAPKLVIGPKNAECVSKDGMVCCPCTEGIKYTYYAPTQCYVPMEYYMPVQCCVPVECEIRYGTPFIPGSKDTPTPPSNCS